jgi:CheY-like chemotaxis protein
LCEVVLFYENCLKKIIVCTVLYIAHSQERSQAVQDLLTHVLLIEPMCFTADGLEALTLTNLFRPDLVLVDALLEKVRGSEVARTLAQAQRPQKIFVLEESFNTAELLIILTELTTASLPQP